MKSEVECIIRITKLGRVSDADLFKELFEKRVEVALKEALIEKHPNLDVGCLIQAVSFEEGN